MLICFLSLTALHSYDGWPVAAICCNLLVVKKCIFCVASNNSATFWIIFLVKLHNLETINLVNGIKYFIIRNKNKYKFIWPLLHSRTLSGRSFLWMICPGGPWKLQSGWVLWQGLGANPALASCANACVSASEVPVVVYTLFFIHFLLTDLHLWSSSSYWGRTFVLYLWKSYSMLTKNVSFFSFKTIKLGWEAYLCWHVIFVLAITFCSCVDLFKARFF